MDFSSILKSLGSNAPGIGGLATGIAGLFGGGGKNPADVGMNYLNNIPGQTQPYYQPYMDAGKGALSDLQNQYKDLLGGGVQNKLGENYKESPGYQFALKQALNASNNAHAAGGQLGIPAHEQANMGIAQGLAYQDYNNYIKNQLGLYGEGLQGEQGLNTMGYNANTGFADNMANLSSLKAQYAKEGQDWKNEQKNAAWNNIFGSFGSLFGGGL